MQSCDTVTVIASKLNESLHLTDEGANGRTRKDLDERMSREDVSM